MLLVESLQNTMKVSPYSLHEFLNLYQESHSFAWLSCSISDSTNLCVNADFP